MVDTYSIFQKKLTNFIDKYYKNLLNKGFLYFALLLSIIFLVLTVIEYFTWNTSAVRLFLLLVFIVSFFFIFAYFILVPLLRYLNVLKKITFRNTIKIISASFPELKDILINIYELHAVSGQEGNQLARASVNQKIESIQSFDFNDAITNKNYRPLYWYLGVIASIYVAIFYIKPAVFNEGLTRIVNYNQFYERDYGFHIAVNPDDLIFEQGESKDVLFYVQGSVRPKELFLLINSKNYLPVQINDSTFKYSFKNINNNFVFRVVNNYYQSQPFHIKVLSPPFLQSISVHCSYPEYIHRADEIITDYTNIRVPVGSKLNFELKSSNTKYIAFYINDSIYLDSITQENFVFFAQSNVNYSIYAYSHDLQKTWIDKASITVIPDLYPTIQVETKNDMFTNLNYYFKGIIGDDYGLSQLAFHFTTNQRDTVIWLPINKAINLQQFYFSYDFSEINHNFSSCYFEVFDNDGINGLKSTRSDTYNIEIPSLAQIADSVNNLQKSLEQKYEKSLFKIDELLRDVKEAKKKLINEKLSDYEKSSLIKSINENQNELENLLDALKKDNLQKSTLNNNFNNFSDQILEKQKAINDLFNDLMTDELKDLLEQFKKLQDNFDEKNFDKLSDKLDLNYKELEKQLDRNLELLKRLDVEQKLENLKDRLTKLSESQENLSKQFNSDYTSDSSKNVISKDIMEMDSIKNDMDETSDFNKELEKPFDLDNTIDGIDNLKEELKNSLNSDAPKEKQKEKFKQNSKDAKDLAQDIDKLLSSTNSTESAENAETLRQILENLIYFSFTQEEILNDLQSISFNNPTFNAIVSRQIDLSVNYSIIKDSLYALSKRTPYLGNHISKRAFSIEDNLFSINESLTNPNSYSSGKKQQRYVLENSNDLILLLSESLKNMENSFGGAGSNSKPNKKNKPNKGKPSLSEMRKSQEGLKNQLEKMISDMKKGENKGQKQGSGQLGKMLAQQEIFQQMLNQLRNSKQSDSNVSEVLNEINNLLEQNKRDIINYNVNQQTIMRQKQILTRLLEAEKAEQERELDEKRTSNEALNYSISNNNLKFEQENEFINFEEIFLKSSLQLNLFFKNKYQSYINNLKNLPNEKGN